MRSRHKSRSAVLCTKGINHQDTANQWPSVSLMFDIHMKLFGGCAGVQSPCPHAAQLERCADDLAASRQQRRIDVDVVELRPSIDEVVNTCRSPCSCSVNIRRIS